MDNLIPIPVQTQAVVRSTGPPNASSQGPPTAATPGSFAQALSAAAEAARAATVGKEPTAGQPSASLSESAEALPESLAALAALILSNQPVSTTPDAGTVGATSPGLDAPASSNDKGLTLPGLAGWPLPLLTALGGAGLLASPGDQTAGVSEGATTAVTGNNPAFAALASGSLGPSGNLPAPVVLAWLERLGVLRAGPAATERPGGAAEPALPGNATTAPGTGAVSLELSALGRALAATPEVADSATGGTAPQPSLPTGEAASQRVLPTGGAVQPSAMQVGLPAANGVLHAQAASTPGAADAAGAAGVPQQPGPGGASPLADAAGQLGTVVGLATDQASQFGNGEAAGRQSRGQPGTQSAIELAVRQTALTQVNGVPPGDALPRSEAVGFSLAPLDPQIAQVIARQARLVTNDKGQEIILRLNPPRLGSLRVQVAHTANQVSVSLVAASHETRRLLEAALPMLRSSLREQGVQVNRIEIVVREPEQQSDSSVTGGFEGEQQAPDAGANGSSTMTRQERDDGLLSFSGFLGRVDGSTGERVDEDV